MTTCRASPSQSNFRLTPEGRSHGNPTALTKTRPAGTKRTPPCAVPPSDVIAKRFGPAYVPPEGVTYQLYEPHVATPALYQLRAATASNSKCFLLTESTSFLARLNSRPHLERQRAAVIKMS